MVKPNEGSSRSRSRATKILFLALTTVIATLTAQAAPPVGQTIWIRSTGTGNFVSADPNRGRALVADRTAIGTSEQFQVVDAGGGFIAFRSVGSGQFVSADLNVNTFAPLIANRAVANTWEHFIWADLAGGAFTLRGRQTNLFVSADQNRGAFAPLVSDRSVAAAWEQFTWGPVGGGVNNPPVFTSNPIVKPNATVNQAYSSSIAGNATDANNDPLTFSKVSGPAWLSVAANGALSGTPAAANSGLNTFSVRVADNRGGASTANLNITVQAANNTSCNLPRRVVVGYWQNFSNGSTFFRVGQSSGNFDVLNLSFATPTTNTDMRMQFVPEPRLYSNNQDFVNDVNLLHGAGKRVVISIGGASGAIDLTTTQQRTDFTNSMISLVNTFNLDGIDIDFEGGAFLRNPNDNNFQSPTTPRIVNAIRAIRDIRNAFSGRCFMLTFAPETFSLQGAYDSYDSAGFTTRGGYVPVIHALRDITTFVMTQDYNTGSVFGLDNNIYENGPASSDSQRSDFHVAMSDMLLQGFPVNRDPARFFPALREDQVVIGLPAAPQAAGSGYTTPIPVQNAVRYLVQRVSYPGRLYTLRKPTGAYPNFRGLMTWSVNWDAANGFNFSNNHRGFLNGLP